MLEALEKAIRNAFEKGNANDPAFREKVYRSAFAALDKALQSKPGTTVEAAINRRKALQDKIANIESEFIPAQPAIDEADDASFSEFPSLSGQERAETDAPGETASAFPGVDPDRDDRRARRGKGRLAKLFLGATVIAAIGIGALWAYQTGIFKSAAERDTAVRTQPASQSEDFTPQASAPLVMPGENDNRNWINVFTPENPAQVSAPSGTSANVMQDESGSFMRISSGNTGSPVMFDVGRGTLEQIAGKKAIFEIVARSEGGQETEMSIDCNFGNLGDCGRKRYNVGYQKSEYLFEVELPAGRPGASGTIAINSDFSNSGKAVDIYEIRVSLSQ
ncbi:hypothetical protein ABFT80_18080 [Mesorhizobium sp. SB112]|uniref:hypothetical protein n=1 Tax=Mesorhizobium sp. SB112 TaxID=3151853 RepID=UPI003266D568